MGGILEVASYLLLFPGVRFFGSRTSISFTFGVTALCLVGVSALQFFGYGGKKDLFVFSNIYIKSIDNCVLDEFLGKVRNIIEWM